MKSKNKIGRFLEKPLYEDWGFMFSFAFIFTVFIGGTLLTDFWSFFFIELKDKFLPLLFVPVGALIFIGIINYKEIYLRIRKKVNL